MKNILCFKDISEKDVNCRYLMVSTQIWSVFILK